MCSELGSNNIFKTEMKIFKDDFVIDFIKNEVLFYIHIWVPWILGFI